MHLIPSFSGANPLQMVPSSSALRLLVRFTLLSLIMWYRGV